VLSENPENVAENKPGPILKISTGRKNLWLKKLEKACGTQRVWFY
jgi:hypothetical protein